MQEELLDVEGPDRPLDTPATNGSQHRLLLRPEEACAFLQLNDEQVQFLINTRQIVSIRIAGEERFDVRDLERLIETYKTTAERRAL